MSPERPRADADELRSHRVSRRAYLGLLGGAGALLAGCLSNDGDPDGESPSTDRPPTATPTPVSVGTRPRLDPGVSLSGDGRQWHPLTLSFDGPATSEDAVPNPFFDYRLDVTFTAPDGSTATVPGYYAADGDAANTDADAGGVWQVRFTPFATGEWRFRAAFHTGPSVAVDVAGAGEPTAFHGAGGSFTVGPPGTPSTDLRTKGRLAHVGEHYFRFSGSGEYFLKTGADSPENFLAYYQFSGTTDARGEFLHRYRPHRADWRPGDPTWMGGKGKSIVGATNYLASEGVNAQYVMTYTADGGDGGDVWPWVSLDEKTRYDVSKLAQWDVVFAHMNALGIVVQLVTQETENDHVLDGGDLGPTRKLYYRELVARFGHHNGLVWNLGEENTNTPQQRADYVAYLTGLDAYGSPIVAHSYPARERQRAVYDPLLGDPDFDGISAQIADYRPNETVRYWRSVSAVAGRPWVVNVDEPGDFECGVPVDGTTCDGVDQAHVRKHSLWGSLLGGAAGVEWYFGYRTEHHDIDLEDFRSRDRWWDYSRFARELLEQFPFWEMEPVDALDGVPGYGFAKPGVVYLFALVDGGRATVTLDAGDYTGRWYDPRGGVFVGDPFAVEGGAPRRLDAPPIDDDVVVVLTTA